MAKNIELQQNNSYIVYINDRPEPEDGDLAYYGEGGSMFPLLENDYTSIGGLWHKGHSKITADLSTKVCNVVDVSSHKLTTLSGKLEKGLFILKNNKYYWDEVYTTPIGQFKALDGASEDTPPTLIGETAYKFYISGNNSEELYIQTKDRNIIPKIGDYIYIQRAKEVVQNLQNDSYTDDIYSFPVELNVEGWQFRIEGLYIIHIDGPGTVYKLILDKSIKVEEGKYYNFVLLNRLNTGIQKELFFDTFQQIEIHRQQLLGDPYNNINNTAKQKGRKNFLDYNGSKYLGMQSLMKDVINSTKTPFLVYSIENDIKDKIATDEFEFLLPFIMVQEDLRATDGVVPTSANKLIIANTITLTDKNLGLYSELKFDWDIAVSYTRIGYIFHDLRIIIIDHSEVVAALSYNSNRNFTLPKPLFLQNSGNRTSNPGGYDVQIINVTNTNPAIITTVTAHNFTQGQQVTIKNVYVRNSYNNIISASVNGTFNVKLLNNNDPNKFVLYDGDESNLILGNGVFVKNNSGSSGIISGSVLAYKYFYTYRVIGSYENSAPYSQTINFNFVDSDNKPSDSDDSTLSIKIPKLTYLDISSENEGFTISDLQLIIGKYQNENIADLTEITGYRDVVVLSPLEIIPDFDIEDLKTALTSTDGFVFTISKSHYIEKIDAIGNGMGSYNPISNMGGDPEYDLINNYKIYKFLNLPDIPNDLIVGKGKWTFGNISYKNSSDRFRSTISINIPANRWNDTSNPTYNPKNEFITDRYISEIGLFIEGDNTDIPAIYTKIAPAIKKTNNLDISLRLNLDW